VKKEDVLYVPRKEHVQEVAQRSALHRLLERIKLHTDVTQITYIDEHADSYFYLDGGYPRKLFVYSLIRRSSKTPDDL
jgi:hypothetical protein